ncbi:hypothetical protein [Burkholderia phage BCSR5]|nr:hypothetical protein [Burkholderia phage BCSR5]
MRQYFYKQHQCTAHDAGDPECICWHDEGTGPFPDRRESDTNRYSWRDKPVQQTTERTIRERICEIRTSLLATSLPYETARLLRKELSELQEKHYVPLHTAAQYLEFLSTHEVTTKRINVQDTNRPYVWCLFNIACQHVYGDTVKECLDKAMAIVYRKPRISHVLL